ncbi:hypothetical protein ON010_g13007 [Phytophthora cinnamomi]|nr:hypothetical protein ON010_g13007 [Phytophthora cinnamomi]
MWHGLFRVAEVINIYAVRLEIAASQTAQAFASRLKTKIDSISTKGYSRKNSWDAVLADDEYEVERIADMRSGRRTRYGRTLREVLVHWKGYDEPTWVDEADLNCGALLHDYLREQANRHRFEVMQSHEDH